VESKTERIYYMDLARAVILLTGVFFHAALNFEDSDNSLHVQWFPHALAVLIDVMRRFRMEALFVVSGYFSGVLVESRGVKGFFRNRTVRMGVPLLFCGTVFNPIPYLFMQPRFVPWRQPFYFINGVWKNHLWNIANLLAYETTLFTALIFLPTLHRKLSQTRVPALVVVAGYVLAFLGFQAFWAHLPGFRFPDFFVTAGHLPRYAPAYLLGYFVQRNRVVRESLFDLRISLPLAVVATVAERIVSVRIPDGMAVTTLLTLERIALACVLFSFVRAVETPNIWIRRLSIASYTIYLLHMPFQMAFMAAFPWLREGWLSYFLVGFVPIPLFWAFHVYVVERVDWAGFLFNGKVYTPKTRSF